MTHMHRCLSKTVFCVKMSKSLVAVTVTIVVVQVWPSGSGRYPQDSTMSNTIKQKNPRNSKGPADIWRNSTAQATPLSAHRMAAKVYIDKLNLTGEQRSQISRLYDQNVIEDFTYFPDNEHEQIAAAALLAAHHLDFDARECLASRWSIKWGVNSGKGSAADRRVLYQW
jgi:hypothetical protein